MLSPLIGTLPFKEVKAVKSLNGPHIDNEGRPFDPTSLDMMRLDDAIHASHPKDCFFTCYTVSTAERWPRLSKQALHSYDSTGLKVVTQVIAFDWDCPGHAPWTQDLFNEFFRTFYALTDPHLTTWRYVYTSKHGARVIYTLPEPVAVLDGEQYVATLFVKFKEAGIHMDEACKDWTRLFRCPHVLRDGKDSTEEPFYFFDEQKTDLNMVDLHKSTPRVIPRLLQTDAPIRSGQPSQEEVHNFLTEKGSQGRGKKSQFYKDAKEALKYCDFKDALFADGVPLATHGNRNDEIMRAVGTAIPILLKKISYTSPAHVFALFYNTILEMDQDMDWLGHTWNAIVTIWPIELAKYNDKAIAEAEEEEQAIKELDRIAEGMAAWCKSPELADPDTRTAFVERHLLANFGKFFYPIMPDGGYSPFHIGKDQLIAYIRTTKHLNRLIQTYELGPTGKLVDVPDRYVHNRYAIPVYDVVYVPEPGRSGHIDTESENNKILKLPMYRRNPKLKPEYNPLVEEWLAATFGRHFEAICDWIANALAFEEGPICALSLVAPPSIGKKMLMEGLAECLETPTFATGADISGQFNGALAKTPFLFINEEWPKNHLGKSAQEMFKTLVTGDRLTIRDLYKPSVQVANPMRLLMIANNHDITKAVFDKDMSLFDRGAMGLRLSHYDLDDSGARWLEERGGNALTGKKGARWIAGSPVQSDYILAKHFLHLHATREVPADGFVGRLLVEGNCARNNPFMSSQVVGKDTTSAVITAVLNILEAKSGAKMYKTDENHALYVTINSVMRELALIENKMPFDKIRQILGNITRSQHTHKIGGLEHHDVDCDQLLRYASAEGRDTPELRKLIEKQKAIDTKNKMK